MGGMDVSGMHIYMFLDEENYIRWNKKVFYLGRHILNSFILYQQNINHEKNNHWHNFVHVIHDAALLMEQWSSG